MTTVTDSESDAAGLERDHAVPVLMRVLQGFKRHSLGRPGDCSLGRSRRKGANILRPRSSEITNRYNENDGVSKRVHELAFGIVICFGSEG